MVQHQNIEELARLLLDGELAELSSTTDAAFEAYASEYTLAARMVCKGCHNN